jgi:hypothetical protein
MSFKRFLIISAAALAAVFIIVLIALSWIDQDYYLNLVTEKIRSSASAVGGNVVITKPSFSGFSYRAEGVSFTSAKNPFYLALGDLKVSPYLFGIALKASAYGGLIEAYFSRSVSAALKDIHCIEHPQLLGLGLSDGIINGDLTGLRCNNNLCTAGDISLKISSIQAHHLFMIGELDSGALYAKAHFSAEGLTFETLDIQSSLFSARGLGLIPYNTAAGAPFEIKVIFTEAGQKKLGAFFAMISRQKIPPEAKQFILRWNGTWRNGSFELLQ